jgi:predicted GTPase
LTDSSKKPIQDAAYYIWLNRGRPEGHDFEIWQEAEMVLLAAKKHKQEQMNMNSDNSRLIDTSYASYRLTEIKDKIQYYPMDIMLVGATGVGKSTTLNALLGTNKAKVGVGVDPETKKIEKYMLNQYIRLWDTPGLGDNPENDGIYKERIVDLLREEYLADDRALIDLVLILVDASTRDMGTLYDLLESIFNNIDPNRVLVVVNQADMAMSGRHWKDEKPDEKLEDFLERQVLSVQRRIKQTIGENIKKPLYYSASNKFNLYSLLDYVIDNFKWKPRKVADRSTERNEYIKNWNNLLSRY